MKLSGWHDDEDGNDGDDDDDDIDKGKGITKHTNTG